MTETALPPSLVERAAGWLAAGGYDQPLAPPRRAATVLLLRDSAAGPEVYLLRRAMTMAFASGMYACPGGCVVPRDAAAETAWYGPSPAAWATLLGVEDEATARAVVCAAVRETYEESGVLLAAPPPGGSPSSTVEDDDEAERVALVNRRRSLADVLAARGLAVRADLLRPWTRWVTPAFEARRYDTHFFVAALPSGQSTRYIEGGEADRVEWRRPADALADASAGRIVALPPTVAALRAVAAYSDVAAVLAGAGEQDAASPIEPLLVSRRGELRLVLPDDLAF